MNKENLETGLTKLIRTFFTKRFERDFSDLKVVLDEYEEDADDIDEEGNWVSAESYYFTIYSNNFNGLSISEMYSLARELFGNILGGKNWIDIQFLKYPL